MKGRDFMNISERNFEEAIEFDLLNSGYKKEIASNYDTKYGLFLNQLFDFITSSQKEKWEKLISLAGDSAKSIFLERLEKEIKSRGLIHVLRKQFVVRGIYFDLVYFKPNNKINSDLNFLYKKNILTVSRQLFFSPKNNKSLDMVLSLNGFPIVTIEIKNPMTGQDVHNAIHQYKTTRNPNELIFEFNKRSLVHFAVDTNEVYMTTKLNKEKTYFLPFNKGHNSGSGNPSVTIDDYKTSYLWNEVLQKDSLLDIVKRFIHKQEDKLIFPRYHQLDAVRKLCDNAEEKGSGTNYLIQHSAGSGKSNSIAWLAHRLSSLHNEKDEPVFDSVVIITDRKVLDRQLKNTIYQFEHKKGVIEWAEHSSKELAEYLENGTKIIITTLQKFPFALDKIKELPNRKYAVIIDEAHSSQSGEAANAVRETLGEKGDDEDHYNEVEKTIQQKLLSQGKQNNLSFFAFTATPKKSTLEVFGTKVNYEAKPKPFHIYSMKQAIQEGFILDVLRNYTTYNVYYNVFKKISDDPDVDKRKATRAVAHFVASHPETIAEKTKIAIEHFKNFTSTKINGNAKAMLITASRMQAVLYKLAFDKYVRENGYANMKALVAFSGTVIDDTGYEHTEEKMNGGIKESELPEEFKKDEYKFLIVANKYQTGFDQLLLHTMYVDKKIKGINAVQTLSRLNRTTSGKVDTFILDFANDPIDIKESFQPYYQSTSIDKNTDPDTLYDFQQYLDDSLVYYPDEVDAFAKTYFTQTELERKQHAQLDGIINQCRERYNHELDEVEQELFKATVNKYVDTYNYLTQLIPFEDEYLLKLFVFGKRLAMAISKPFAPIEGLGIEKNIDLARLRVVKIGDTSISLDDEDGTTTGGYGIGANNLIEEKSSLSIVIQKINERFGENFSEEGFGGYIQQLVDDGLNNEELINRAKNNKYKEFFNYSFKDTFSDLLFNRMEKNSDAIDKIMNNEELADTLMDYIAMEIYKRSKNKGE